MKCFGKAEEAARVILKAFENPNSLPKPLAAIFISRKDGVPCRAWSWRNQLLVMLAGHDDARGYRQWEQVGRHVKKGEKAFHILSPCTKTRIDEETLEKRTAVYGFRGTPVFGLSQTEGTPLEKDDRDADSWVDSLPVIEVAKEWGLSVKALDGKRHNPLGCFTHVGNTGTGIALGVKNLSTWTHELVHAADLRNGKFDRLGQHWRNEVVAELGGAVLLQVLGYDYDVDLGGCWNYIQHYAKSAGTDELDACGKVLTRTCEAVALILDTAEQIQAGNARQKKEKVIS